MYKIKKEWYIMPKQKQLHYAKTESFIKIKNWESQGIGPLEHQILYQVHIHTGTGVLWLCEHVLNYNLFLILAKWPA